MRNKTKFFGIIALVAVIGFSMAGCGDPENGPTGGTDTVIDIAAIQGVTAPVTGATPVTAITPTAQYTGTVAWNGNSAIFAASNVYTATITLTAKAGFTLQGVAANFFTVAGTTSVINNANSGVITAAFPATGVLNTTALLAKIAEAESLQSQAEVNTAAENVALGGKWVTQTVMTAFENAIGMAESVLASATNQTALDNAVTALQNAMTTFENAWQDGEKTSGFSSEQVSALLALADADKDGVTTSTNGDDVSPAAYWVSSSGLETFNAAITALENASEQTAIDDAYLALVAARAIFNTAKRFGTPADKTALNNAMNAANNAKAGVETGASKEEVPSGKSWATVAQFTTLNNAIAAATAVNANPNATKNAVDAATSDMTAATNTFNTAVTNNGPGTMPVGTPVTTWKGLTVPTATKALQYTTYQGKSDVLHVSPSGSAYEWAILSYNLDAYSNKEITITLSVEVWLQSAGKVVWQANQGSYPEIAGNYTELAAGQWHTVTGNTKITVDGTGKVIYLSKDQLGAANEAYIANFTVNIVESSGGGEPIANPLHLKWPFYVGAAATSEVFNPSDGQYSLLGHFNVLVAGNEMKAESIMPSQWQNWQSSPAYNATQAYRWTEADKLVNYAEANNTKIRGHVLFWHEQTPEVFFRTGNMTSAYVSKEVLYTRMEQHTKTVFQKYGGRILWWDVVNECVDGEGNPRVIGGANVGNSEGKSGYTAVMEGSGLTGDDRYEWIVNAFKYARKYADENGGQNVKLFITEYGIEEGWAETKRDGFLRLVDYLITNDAPIDGVGIQGHTSIHSGDGGYVNDLSSVIDQITAKKNPAGKNLIVQVCELDISLFAWDDPSLTLSSSEVNTRLQPQAKMYRDLFDMFADKHGEGKFDMVVVWGLDDGHSWLNDFPTPGRTDHPLLFDRQYQPKPAFNSLITGPSGLMVPNPYFEGWGGLGGKTGNTFAMVKEAENTYDCKITYQFPEGASAYANFTVSLTVTKTADFANKSKVTLNDLPKDDWDGGHTFEDYRDYETDGSYSYTHACSGNNSFTIGINKHDSNNPTADFTIVINSIKFHD